MAVQTFVLLDDKQSADQQITPAKVGGKAQGYEIGKQRLQTGSSQGVDLVTINNGRAVVKVIPTRGMGLWNVTVDGVRFGWKSPVRGPVHPAFVPLAEDSGLGWLDGFDELLVRCGLESNGAPDFDEKTGRVKYPLHGRIGNKPAHRVEVSVDGDSGEISLRGVVEETRFHFLKLRMTTTLTTKIGEPGIRITDEIENFSNSPSSFQMLYHVNYGLPVLDGGSRVIVAAEEIVPRNDHAAGGIKTWDHYSAPQPGFEEQVYFLKLRGDDAGQTQVLLKNAHGTQGSSLLFNLKQLPCFTIWKNTTGDRDGYVTGLEPGTNYPNPRTYEEQQQRVVKLAGGEKASLELQLQFHTKAAEVTAAETAVAKLNAGKQPKIHDKPQAGWCS